MGKVAAQINIFKLVASLCKFPKVSHQSLTHSLSRCDHTRDLLLLNSSHRRRCCSSGRRRASPSPFVRCIWPPSLDLTIHTRSIWEKKKLSLQSILCSDFG